MKKLLSILIFGGQECPRYVRAANDHEETQICNSGDGDGVFEIQQKDSLFVPYGEYPHTKGLQKFDKQSGDFLVHAFNSLGAKVGRIFTAGVPIYRGHPDVPGRPDTNPSAPAMGWVNTVSAENDGVRFGVKWNTDGEAAIGNAHYRFYSPNWLLRQVKGGIQPVKLLSIGLTNNPRIPVPAIANDDNPTNDPEMKLTALLRKLLGFAENDTPTDDQIEANAKVLGLRIETLQAAANDLNAMRPKLATAESDLLTVRGQVTAIGTERDTLRGQLTAANDATKAARGARIDVELQRLIDGTRLEPAKRDTVRGELLAIENDADLTTRLTAMHTAKPLLKTTTKTGDLGKQKSELKQAENDQIERSRQRLDAVATEKALLRAENSALSPTDLHNVAWERAQRKNPTLFTEAAE